MTYEEDYMIYEEDHEGQLQALREQRLREDMEFMKEDKERFSRSMAEAKDRIQDSRSHSEQRRYGVLGGDQGEYGRTKRG